MNTILLLDLENTIIEDWSEAPNLLGDSYPELKEWVGSHVVQNARVGLLSWAIWNDDDLIKFNKRFRPVIEDGHGFKFDDSLIFNRDKLLTKFQGWKRMPFLDGDDFMSFFNKRIVCEELWLHEFSEPETKIVFLDDTVPDMVLKHSTIKNNSLELVNPWTIIRN